MSRIWLPRWKCSSLNPESIPAPETTSSSFTSSVIEMPNFDASPPDAAHFPEPVADTFTRTPKLGTDSQFLACAISGRISEYFSRIGMTFFPSCWPISSSRIITRPCSRCRSAAVRSSSRCGSAATSSAFEPHSRPKPKRPARFENLLHHFVKLIHFDRIHADIRVLVARFLDGFSGTHCSAR